MKQTFDRAADFVARWEGGLVNDKDDPGKLTNFGLSKAAHPELDIAALTPSMARDWYYKLYWVPMGCDSLPYPLDLVVFDTAFNCGIDRTKRWIQETRSDPIALLFRRLSHYATLCRLNRKFEKFIIGWLNRVNDLYKTARKEVL